MSKKKYCYACRDYHEETQVVQFHTRRGVRWRCQKSIDSARAPREARDAFGRFQTQINKEESRRAAEFVQVLNRFQMGY